jgi:SulP family sulfate permease
MYLAMQNLPEVKTNLLSGLTVALAMVPEAIAFALIAQVSHLPDYMQLS